MADDTFHHVPVPITASFRELVPKTNSLPISVSMFFICELVEQLIKMPAFRRELNYHMLKDFFDGSSYLKRHIAYGREDIVPVRDTEDYSTKCEVSLRFAALTRDSLYWRNCRRSWYKGCSCESHCTAWLQPVWDLYAEVDWRELSLDGRQNSCTGFSVHVVTTSADNSMNCCLSISFYLDADFKPRHADFQYFGNDKFHLLTGQALSQHVDPETYWTAYRNDPRGEFKKRFFEPNDDHQFHLPFLGSSEHSREVWQMELRPPIPLTFFCCQTR